MLSSFVALLGFGVAFAARETSNEKRATVSIGGLYAFGQGINGLPVFYGDGTAYAGYNAPPGVGIARNLTFYHPSDSNNSVVGEPTTTATDWVPPSFIINDAPGAIDPAGFITSTNTTNSTIETQFVVFGHALYYKSSSGTIQSQFYAAPADVAGTYTLLWNSDNSVQETSTPVILKNLAPPTRF